ncbi:MAG: arginase [Treponema sp.]|nr:arginase [Treponema sp.]MCI6892070.1 arginase [Treponema sp.]MCI7567688.1 arginase [Treponema sp.]
MNVHILEMPLDFGASRHGSDMGPSAIRLAGIKERLEYLNHKTFEHADIFQPQPQEYEQVGNPKAKYLKPIVNACTKLAASVEEISSKGDFPLVLGGDHSIVLGTLAGLAASAKKENKKIGVLYVDAHGDFNDTNTSPTGNIHGECLAASAGLGLPELTNLYFEGQKVDPHNICFVGCRDLDPGEKVLMKKAGVTVFTMSDIDRQGFSEIVKKVLKFFETHADWIHVSFDMDVLDPMYAPGTGIPLPGGLTNREALLLMEEMASIGKVKSAEIVEVNPILDVRNQTAILAVSLAARLLGETLY